LACRNALLQMESYGQRLANAKFRTDLHTQIMLTMDERYPWLASDSEVPKQLGERLDRAALATLRPRPTLAAADALLVKARMALETSAEQMMRAGDADLADYFLRSRDFVRAVDYEVTVAMAELNVSHRQ
jgi:hypothetical protein